MEQDNGICTDEYGNWLAEQWRRFLPNPHDTLLLLSPPPSQYRQPPADSTRLVIADFQSIEQLKQLLEDGQLPPLTPIVLLLHRNEPSTLPALFYEKWFIDHFALPAPRNDLRQRLFFLEHIRQTLATYQAQTATMARQLAALYSRDGLTGLYNRRHLIRKLEDAFAAALEQEQDLTVLLINIDYFNNINKALGFQFGDSLLNQLAARLTQNTREEDSCFRFSGEEFLVLMPDTDLNSALELATTLGTKCTDKPFSDGQKKKSITLSMGIASRQRHHPDNHEELICMAETALMVAKAEGRNRIQVYQPLTGAEEAPSWETMTYLNNNLGRILEKTRESAVASLQLLAKHVAGPGHLDHIERISRFIDLLGEEMNLPEHHLQTFHNSATLYNSFRFLLHHDLLGKAEELTADEHKVIADLPYKLAEITEMFDYFSNEKGILQNHCERYDGSGYPRGLQGDEIPFGARLFNIVNALAAMSAERPYRRRLSPREIVEELQREAGRQFDPYLVLQVLQMIKKHRLLDISTDFIDRVTSDLTNLFPEISS